MAFSFQVIPSNRRIPSEGQDIAYLHVDHWDDWFKFEVMYYMTLYDADGNKHEIGSVKIGEFDQEDRRASIPNRFRRLSDRFFSLGQDADYYSNIYRLDEDLRRHILIALNDFVFDQELFKKALDEDVTKIALLRNVSPASVKGQFLRILNGGDRLSGFSFKYELPQGKRTAGFTMQFKVKPDSNPPTNIHVVIGRNGVGKTHLLNNMVRAIVDDNARRSSVGELSSMGIEQIEDTFSGVVSVSFSAFDPFEPLEEQRDKTDGIRYSYIGLKRATNRGGAKGTPKSPDMLTNEFMKSLRSCLRKGKQDRWQEAILTLESDPLFKYADLGSLVEIEDDNEVKTVAAELFEKLSSGHKIVLLTITRLIQVVEEKTLVLLDEPEAHLHPPLLSAFVRALSELMAHRNGVAIIATHSPVILQEVPSTCVWRMSRTGLNASADRPEIETFGENIGILTRATFGLEVTRSGFHQLLEEAVSDSSSFDQVMEFFDDQLGAEAKAIAQGLLINKTTEGS